MVLSAHATHAAADAIPRTLTFEDRVRAQEAIERVYYEHQIGTTKPFEQAVPRAVLEAKVRDTLRRSAALEKYWRTPVTTASLQAELERMARRTRYPDRLLEIYRALGNDPTLIRETFARQSLVDRLTRNFFDFDATLHAEARGEADDLEGRLRTGRLGLQASDTRRSVAEFTRANPGTVGRGPNPAGKPGVVAADGVTVIDLTAEEFDRARSRAPAQVEEIGPVVDRRDAFVITVVLEESRDRFRTASWVVPKRSWESWWGDAGPALDGWKTAAPDVGADTGPVPSPRTATSTAPSGAVATCDPAGEWDNGALDDFPGDIQTSVFALWTGSVMVALGIHGNDNQGGRYDPVTDSWSQVTMTGAPRILPDQSAVWTGSSVIVWGGHYNLNTYPNTGARYDPVSDSWSAISAVGAPSGRGYHSAVWTGQVMIVWGGYDGVSEVNTGGSYNPATDTWQAVSPGFSARQHHTAVWGNGQMLVWGGSAAGINLASGSRYNPMNNMWIMMSDGQPALMAESAGPQISDAPAARAGHVAVWTGSEMIIWGGSGSGGNQMPGSRYNSMSDTWTTMSSTNQPWSIPGKSAVWTGARMLVWGGFSGLQNPGGSYDPVTDTWQKLSNVNTPGSGPTVWTGSRMIVFTGGQAPSGRYDPGTDTWTAASMGGAPSMRRLHAAVWTGNVMVVWGGYEGAPPGTPTNTGGRYDPLADSWSPTSMTDAPAPNGTAQAVWAGSVMVAIGGLVGPNLDIRRYDPVLDVWQPIPPAPPGVGTLLGATGNRVVFIGGAYDLVQNSWTPLSTTGAPTTCQIYSCTSVWTGSGAILWGSNGNAPYQAMGARYDDATGRWAAMNVFSGPVGRRNHTAVWTGTRMFVWGGYNGTAQNNGGLYDPVSDTWQPVSTVNSPNSGSYPTSIWTGHEAVVWGGNGFPSNIGGQYDPVLNAWVPTASENAPLERLYHSAVWTGNFMVIWGGESTRTGGRYVTPQGVDLDGDGYTTCAGDCDDSNPLIHPGAVEICDGRDNNCNGVSDEDFGDADGDQWGDACDCAPNDATAFALPGALRDVTWPTTSSLAWTSVAPTTGAGTVYDVVRGLAGQGPVGSGPSSEICLAAGVPDATAPDAANPSIGTAWYYLVRARNACGNGGYGQASSGAERVTHACAP